MSAAYATTRLLSIYFRLVENNTDRLFIQDKHFAYQPSSHAALSIACSRKRNSESLVWRCFAPSQHNFDTRLYALGTCSVMRLLESAVVQWTCKFGRPLKLDVSCTKATFCIPKPINRRTVAGDHQLVAIISQALTDMASEHCVCMVFAKQFAPMRRKFNRTRLRTTLDCTIDCCGCANANPHLRHLLLWRDT